MPGGVSSPVRSFQAVGGDPVVIAYGRGPHIVDVDGRSYIDYVGAYGPLILGHAPPRIAEVVAVAAQRGTAYGATSELEIELARLICEAVPSMGLVRFVNSGTEATMSALRLARAATGRDAIVKFEGGYHGHADGLLVRAGSGVTTLSLPASAGVPKAYAAETLLAPYNDIEAVKALFEAEGERIAAVILEPIAANMGVVPPADGFLEGLREITREAGALLIFDEVVTGFRAGPGGAQERYGVMPDLTCLGKIIGGGLPVGAYGGKKEIMDHIAPVGAVYQAGTLSGNPLAVTAGIEMLNLLSQPGVYDDLEKKSERLCNGFKENVKKLGITATFTRVGSLFSIFFTDQEIINFDSVKTSDTEFFKRYFNAMLEEGIYIAPSQFEAGFMSAVHTDDDIDQTIAAQSRALKKASG